MVMVMVATLATVHFLLSLIALQKGPSVIMNLRMEFFEALLKEGGAGGQDEEALIGVYKSASTGSNGSAVKVREVGGHFN